MGSVVHNNLLLQHLLGLFGRAPRHVDIQGWTCEGPLCTPLLSVGLHHGPIEATGSEARAGLEQRVLRRAVGA